MNRGRSVSNERRPDGLAVDDHGVDEPGRVFAGGARAPCREDRVPVGEELGRDEEVREGRVGCVVPGRGDHDLGVAGQLDRARAPGAVRDRDAPESRRRPRARPCTRCGCRGRRRVAGTRRGPAGRSPRTSRQAGAWAGSRSTRNARSRRRGRSRRDRSRRRRVLPPARHLEVVPARVPGPGVVDHHVVPAVREQVDLGPGEVRCREDPDHGLALGAAPHLAVHPDRVRIERGHLRHPLLEQQIGRPDLGHA